MARRGWIIGLGALEKRWNETFEAVEQEWPGLKPSKRKHETTISLIYPWNIASYVSVHFHRSVISCDSQACWAVGTRFLCAFWTAINSYDSKKSSLTIPAAGRVSRRSKAAFEMWIAWEEVGCTTAPQPIMHQSVFGDGRCGECQESHPAYPTCCIDEQKGKPQKENNMSWLSWLLGPARSLKV